MRGRRQPAERGCSAARPRATPHAIYYKIPAQLYSVALIISRKSSVTAMPAIMLSECEKCDGFAIKTAGVKAGVVQSTRAFKTDKFFHNFVASKSPGERNFMQGFFIRFFKGALTGIIFIIK